MEVMFEIAAKRIFDVEGKEVVECADKYGNKVARVEQIEIPGRERTKSE